MMKGKHRFKENSAQHFHTCRTLARTLFYSMCDSARKRDVCVCVIGRSGDNVRIYMQYFTATNQPFWPSAKFKFWRKCCCPKNVSCMRRTAKSERLKRSLTSRPWNRRCCQRKKNRHLNSPRNISAAQCTPFCLCCWSFHLSVVRA